MELTTNQRSGLISNIPVILVECYHYLHVLLRCKLQHLFYDMSGSGTTAHADLETFTLFTLYVSLAMGATNEATFNKL